MKRFDRYVLQRFGVFLLFAMLASIVIFLTVDSTEHLDKFIDARVPYTLVLRYYYLYLPYIIYLTLPVSVLLATLFTIGGMVYRNELTAMQSAGYSLWRILWLFLLVAVPLSGAMLLFGETVVPSANLERKTLYLVEVRKKPNPATQRKGRLYIQVGQNEFLKMESYDPETQTGGNSSLHTFVNGELQRRVTAERVRWGGSGWMLMNVETRDFAAGLSVSRTDSVRRSDLAITPDDLARVNIEPEEMNYVDLRNLVQRLQASGVRAGKWIVDLRFKVSQPFATVIIVLFGVPFAAFRRRGGLVLGFGLSLLVCFVYFGMMQVGKILGYNGILDATLAAWAGNIVFGIIGIGLVLRVPK